MLSSPIITPLPSYDLIAKPFLGGNACGVYFLLLKKRVVYVGQSINIAWRIKQHKKARIFDEVMFIELSRELLDEVERHYIYDLRPEGNGGISKCGMRLWCAPPMPCRDLIEQHKPLSGPQLRKILRDKNCSQTSMARSLEIGERTMRDHLTKKEVPKHIQIAVLCILNHTEKRK